MVNTIDIATMLPRTVEAADLQGREISQSQHAMEQTGVQFEKQTEQDSQRTVETKESDTEEYDMGDSQGRGGAASGSRKKKAQKKKDAPMAPRSNSSFDIMI